MKLYMAPLQGYTTSFYRQAHALTYGKMDKYFTPFFDDADTTISTLRTHPELLPKLNSELCVVPQVATNSSNFLIDFSNAAKTLGYDEININMGCPFPMLVKRQKGGGILQHPDIIEQLLTDFFGKTKDIKLSIKMRLGHSKTEEGQTIVKLLNQFPIEEVIIHPRLVTQKYGGDVNWDEFKVLRKLSQHTMVANGDINTPEQAQILLQQLPDTKALMLGRGLLTKPELPCKITQQTHSEISIFTLHNNFFKLVTNHFNDWNQAFNHFITFWHYPLQANQDLKRLYRKLKKHNKPDTYNEWLNKLRSTYL